MLQELQGKKVSIAFGSTEFSHALKGEVIEINDSWLKIQAKKGLEYVRVDAIIKIAVSS